MYYFKSLYLFVGSEEAATAGRVRVHALRGGANHHLLPQPCLSQGRACYQLRQGDFIPGNFLWLAICNIVYVFLSSKIFSKLYISSIELVLPFRIPNREGSFLLSVSVFIKNLYYIFDSILVFYYVLHFLKAIFIITILKTCIYICFCWI